MMEDEEAEAAEAGGGGGGGIQNQKQEPDTNNGEKSPAPKLRKSAKGMQTETSPIEHEAFVPDVPQKVKVEDVKTKLSCETSLKK